MSLKPTDILLNCSSLGDFLTDGRSKADPLGETCKTAMIDRFIQAKYGRREDKDNKYFRKGNYREEDNITLVSLKKEVFYTKNKIRLENDFITGEHDMHSGKLTTAPGPRFELNGSHIMLTPADTILDTKCSWSLFTFLRSSKKKVDPKYYAQVQGYCLLTGAKSGAVAHSLLNGTDTQILDEKRRLQWKLGILDPSAQAQDSEFIKGCIEIEKNHIFDIKAFMAEYPHIDLDSDTENWEFDIPAKDRVHIFEFERDEEFIQRIIQRAKDCQEWMAKNLF